MIREHKYFLDSLRESGEVNMFGAAPHLAKLFCMDIKEARKVVSEWADSFGKVAPKRGYKHNNTSCSSCGDEFGPGDSNFSHCDQHKGLENVCL